MFSRSWLSHISRQIASRDCYIIMITIPLMASKSFPFIAETCLTIQDFFLEIPNSKDWLLYVSKWYFMKHVQYIALPKNNGDIFGVSWKAWKWSFSDCMMQNDMWRITIIKRYCCDNWPVFSWLFKCIMKSLNTVFF